MESGWIKIHRKIAKSWVFSNADYLKAWLTVLIEVNVEPADVVIHGVSFPCGRGEKLYSLSTWAEKFGRGWDRHRASRFLKRLEAEQMVALKTEHLSEHLKAHLVQRLTVLNYETYQDSPNSSCDTSRNTDRDGYKNIKTNNTPPLCVPPPAPPTDLFGNPPAEPEAKRSAPKSFKKWSEDEFDNSVKSFPEYAGITGSFVDYWTEKSASGLMRFQMEKTWETQKRLRLWASRERSSRSSSPSAPVNRSMKGF